MATLRPQSSRAKDTQLFSPQAAPLLGPRQGRRYPDRSCPDPRLLVYTGKQVNHEQVKEMRGTILFILAKEKKHEH
jgi:hypothetical protein